MVIEVEYHDSTPGIFGLHYDAIPPPQNPSAACKRANRSVLLRGSNVWKTAAFPIYGAAFGNLENGGADFRITVRPAELYVRRVSVTRAPGLTPTSRLIQGPAPFAMTN